MSWYALIALLACRPGGEKPDSGDTEVTIPVVVIPTVRVVSPAEGEVLTTSDVEVILNLTDFRLEPPKQDTGGAHLSPLLLPLLAIPEARAHGDLSDPSGYVRFRVNGEDRGLTTESIFTVEDLPDGEHSVEVELYWAEDNDAFYPPVEAEVTFTVSAPPPE